MPTPETLAHGQALIAQLKQLFAEMEQKDFDFQRLGNLYADNMIFQDSFHHVISLASFQEYCQRLYSNVSYCHFDFQQEFVQRDQAVLFWRMNYAHPKLNKGADIQLEGCSLICFDGKITYHQDYFDGGQLLYEHLPVVGGLVRWVKKRMQQG